MKLIDKQKYINIIKNNNTYYEDYVTRSVYHSNAIEGSTLSYFDTYQIIFDTTSSVPLKNIKPRELYEAINLKYAINYMFENIDESVNVSYIIDLGKIINKNISEINGFRTSSVGIRGAEHIPPNAAAVPRLINELIYASFRDESIDVLLDLAEFHIRYERIHPFGDGNGRTGRVLLNKYAIDNGLPMFVIPIERRQDYMTCLANYDIENLAKLISEAMDNEFERMAGLGIDTNSIIKDFSTKTSP